ncbi:MAG: MoaD/ThiS family protein [Candidatus Micrarchaeota archaeon]|nr:MoaD/ThiS family protein [Candidatus Micrarchaeota archaeon]
MRILLDGKPKTVALRPGVRTGAQLLRILGISPQEALLKLDGQVRPESASITPQSKIEIIRVVFGG